jgi:hypothetical protein
VHGTSELPHEPSNLSLASRFSSHASHALLIIPASSRSPILSPPGPRLEPDRNRTASLVLDLQ